MLQSHLLIARKASFQDFRNILHLSQLSSLQPNAHTRKQGQPLPSTSGIECLALNSAFATVTSPPWELLLSRVGFAVLIFLETLRLIYIQKKEASNIHKLRWQRLDRSLCRVQCRTLLHRKKVKRNK